MASVNVLVSAERGQNWLARDTGGRLDTVETAPTTTSYLRVKIHESRCTQMLGHTCRHLHTFMDKHEGDGTSQSAKCCKHARKHEVNVDRQRPRAAPPSSMISSSLKCLTSRYGSCRVQHLRLDVTIRAAIANRNLQCGQTPGGHLLVAETNRKTRHLERVQPSSIGVVGRMIIRACDTLGFLVATAAARSGDESAAALNFAM